jgi:hypothetical protein
MRKTNLKYKRIWLESRFNDYRSLNINVMFKIDFQKQRVAYGLIKDIKDYHFFC